VVLLVVFSIVSASLLRQKTMPNALRSAGTYGNGRVDIAESVGKSIGKPHWGKSLPTFVDWLPVWFDNPPFTTQATVDDYNAVALPKHAVVCGLHPRVVSFHNIR
jgi:hypothetical protein